MADEIELVYLKVAISQIVLVNRFNKAKSSALTLLTNLAHHFIKRCGILIRNNCEICNIGLI
ncbi:hypothetical protein HZS_4963 [Henneguya salminicola]|nr:hypothetical protein HZS_4963 [Henneguya salminicola]